MKKIFSLLMFLLVGASGVSSAASIESYNLLSASYTITNEGPVVIPNTPPGTVLVGVVVASVTAIGLLRIYNSSGIASGQVANISLADEMNYNFEILLSSGLTYTTSSNSSGVTILYKRPRQ